MSIAERKAQLRDRIIVATGIVAMYIATFISICYAYNKDTIQKYYAIYDVEDTFVVDGQTFVMVNIDGELQVYTLDDEAEPQEVCFEINSEDVTTWKIVTTKE